MKPDLHLHEELLLLGLHERTGKLAASTGYAMAGGMLAELLLAGCIELDGKRALVDAVAGGSLGEPLLDSVLDRIATAKRRAALTTWVGRLGRDRDLLHETAEGLCERGILRAEEVRLPLFRPIRRYPERDPAPELAVLDRLEGALEADPTEVGERDETLVALAYHAGVLKELYGRAWLKRNRRAIERLTELCEVGEATRDAIAAVTRAVLAAVLVAVAVAGP